MIQEKENIPYIVTVAFADSEIPIFKELKNKDYVQYGDDNLYPQYLTRLFNKSAKHNALCVGKAKYIFGGGFANGGFKINRLGESLNDVSPKQILDEVVYGGWYAEVVWNRFGKIQAMYHVDYNTIREDKNGGYLFCEEWKRFTKEEDWKHIDAFDPSKPFGNQIYCFRSYRPGQRYYPLPDYVGAINYIEVDIEIGKFNLSGIRNGMNPSKLIQFFKGEPTEDKKREINQGLNRQFAGAENAGKAVIVFNEGAESRAAEISDLSTSDIDKMYDLLNKTCQQEIFSGHLITNPLLFGIKTEGQLGGATELNISYSIFQNTYSKPKAETFSKEMEYLLSFSDWAGEYELEPTDPVGLQFDVKDVINSLPKEYVFKRMGIPKDEWDKENIGADNRPTPTVPIAPPTEVGMDAETAVVNTHLKNLTGRQLQHIKRVIKQYKEGKIDVGMARITLQSGYDLTDEQVNEFLGIKALGMSADNEDDYIIGMFDACGENRDDFDILRTKPVFFTSDIEDDEEAFKSSFKVLDLTATEAKIIDLIKKDPLVTPDVIGQTIGQSTAYVQSKLDSLTQRGYISVNQTTIGTDTQIEREILPDLNVPPAIIDKVPVTKITVMYSYEGPYDSRNRPFCHRMMELKRLYTRYDIERISIRLGYSVFDRRGGFWTRKGTHDTTPYCRHKWVSQIVIKKS